MVPGTILLLYTQTHKSLSLATLLPLAPAIATWEALSPLAKIAHVQSCAALIIGVALTLHVRAARQGPATGADQAPGPHSPSSASACLNDRVREATKWLQAAFDGGDPFAKLHLAHVTPDTGQEDAALADLKEHLSWRVQRGRDTCAGCGQTRGEDTSMQRLPCSEVLQRRSSKDGFGAWPGDPVTLQIR